MTAYFLFKERTTLTQIQRRERVVASVVAVVCVVVVVFVVKDDDDVVIVVGVERRCTLCCHVREGVG